ncbi:hypothetical protein [Agreia sp. VKM Ac-1783]|uniref:hypothetical protein n=1 Tax=Agreia sp. VKM Ac-1783 TaxID=1938889 RepID=UPI000A2AACF9|nr:hypothetical protein [Agreia sp. VKM Ac-1783]SMQ73456.1 hypothetical protein SAMN06295943_2885 [Agreia sp. VKM Ac-1783]
MTLSIHTYSAKLTTPDAPLSIKGGSITLDEGWSPYVRGTITIAIPALATLARLDPRTNPRLSVSAGCTFQWNGVDLNGFYLPPTSRTFNVVLRERTVDHVAGEVTLTLASDEALLQDYALVATAPFERPDPSGLAAIKAVLTMALGVTPVVAAAITTKTLTNMLPNPGGETNVAGFVTAGGNGVAVGRNSSVRRTGTASVAVYTDGGASMAVIIAPNVNPISGHVVTPGKSYTFSAYSQANKQYFASVALRFHDVSGTMIGGDVATEKKLLTTDSWQRFTVSAVAPPGAVYCWPIYYPDTPPAGVTYFLDDLMLHEGSSPLPAFSGATASTPDVTYSWVGTANASMSRAAVKAYVDPAATVWKPGMTAWDYLEPILSSLQMRLFCDESRVWRLVDSSYVVAGSLRISEARNLVNAADQISRAGAGEWYDAVVIEYTWTEADGATRTAYDAASVPGFTKVLSLKYDTPYPGPGAADYILKRAQGKGRLLTPTAISDYSAQPGMELVGTFPNSPVSTGYVTAVTWSFEDDEMDVTSRGLTDTPLTAWALAPVGRRWQDIAAGVKWNTYTP